ncbi:MAG: type II secretion system protein [Phycisphaerales bacterium]
MNRRKKGFTLIELLVVIAIIALLIGILLPALGKARAASRQLKDSTQIRSIHQAMILWASNNSDKYPIPSEVDRGHQTLANGVKDITRDIFSVLIYNGYFSPEICVSPAESNGNIKIYDHYQYSEPQAAAGDKKLAAWDPAFRALNTDSVRTGNLANDPGGFSYGHTPTVRARRPKWSNSFLSTDAAIGNRGPAYTNSGSGATLSWTLLNSTARTGGGTTPIGLGSNTLAIHGSRTSWEGNISFNDNHVTFETRPDPAIVPFVFTALPPNSRTQLDNVFVNENDISRNPLAETCDSTSLSGQQTNNFLRAYTGGTQVPNGSATGPLTAIQPWYD